MKKVECISNTHQIYIIYKPPKYEIAMNIKKFVKGEYVKNLIPLGKDF